MNRLLALTGLTLSALGTLLLPATPAAAHPLGNLSVNQYAALTISSTGVHVDYVLDLAELPAYQARTQEIDTDHNGAVVDGERDAYARQSCARAATADTLRVGGTPTPLHSSSAAVTFPAGAAGLSTLRLECGLDVATPITTDTEVSFSYGEYTDRIGWREMVLVADGVTISHSTAPASSISNRLTRYPTSALTGAPDVRMAVAAVRPGGPAIGRYDGDRGADGPNRPGVDWLTAAFTSLADHRQLTIAFALGALFIAMVLGCAHALAPGHGKLMMAGYLVNERGNLRQALAIAGTVAVTHTVGVLTLGLVLATGLHFAPQRIYTALTALSGILVTAVGVSLLIRAWRTWRHQRAHQLGHDHDHGHSHHDDDHDHGFGPHRHPAEPIRGRGIIAMGLAGGLSPSPSAIVVLLGAVALGRAWYGVLLVAAYGIGMAATLTGIGYALTHVRARLERRPRAWLSHRGWRIVPLITSTVIIVAGLGVATTALLT